MERCMFGIIAKNTDREEPESNIPREVTFNSSDNDFKRARNILAFAGMTNVDCHGFAARVAEGIFIYRGIDRKEDESQSDPIKE